MLTGYSKIWELKGIGDKKAALYQKLDISTVQELLLHLPRSYIDLRNVFDPATCSLGEFQLVEAVILSKSEIRRGNSGLTLFKVKCEMQGCPLTLIFYNMKYTVDALKIGESYLFHGILNGNLTTREMVSPLVVEPSRVGTLLPVYPATAGLTSRAIGFDVQRALSSMGILEESLPPAMVEELELCTFDEAIRLIHRPTENADYRRARRRLVFEELLVFSLAMLSLKGEQKRQSFQPMERVSLEPLWNELPFLPTDAQLSACNDILADFSSGKVMNRLIQGDVGCGKTLIAAAAAYAAYKNGLQTAMMAPTELLARQHYSTLTQLLTPLGMKVELITGSQKPKERREAVERLRSGESHLVTGTHALLTTSTELSALGLVITDEQHRFGVAQRAALSAKTEAAHTLVMSATPIPRTLSLILYGDLDLTVINEIPPGRTPVKTYLIDSPKRQRCFDFIKNRLNEGRQAYIICPLVLENQEAGEGLISATAMYEQLKSHEFADYSVGLLHGKLKPKEKDAVMADFAAGTLQLLVATTVVEVGVDVPNAVVMFVANAERFGLSQLHQLRGRVGRGKSPSICVLSSDNKSSLTLERLKTLCRTNDGFAIAREDLRLRGPGDLIGLRQHGAPGLVNADLIEDSAILETAQQQALTMLQYDSHLQGQSHREVKRRVEALLAQVAAIGN